MTRRDAARLLGVPEDAPYATAKAAYRRLAQRWHPDRAHGDLEKFQALGLALAQFERTLPCTACSGTGTIITRRGLAVIRIPCPHCWQSRSTP